MPNWKKVIVSGSDATLNSLNLTNATSGATVFSIDGTQGRLFSITDELSGSLFAVSDISGIPSFEVFSDDTVKIGTHNSESIVVSGSELKLSHLSTQGSETDVLTINGSNVVGTRQLSSGAFASAYSLPLATSSTRGGAKIGYTENGKNYPVELSSEKMYVNVPWTDNNTQLSNSDVIGVFSAGTNVTISEEGEISATDTNTQLSAAQVRANLSGTGLIGYDSSTGVISTTANNYVHPTGAGNKHIPTGGASGQFLKYSASGTAVWATPSYTTNTDTNTTYLLKATQYDSGDTDPYLKLDASSGTDDLVQLSGGGATTVTRNSDGQITISSTDNNTQLSAAQVRANLSGTGLISYNSSTGVISTTANNYVLPEATSTTKGGIELFSDTDQTVAAETVSTTTGRTYGLQLNSAGQGVVNVPWLRTRLQFNSNGFGVGDFTLIDGTNASFKHQGGTTYSVESSDTTYTADGNYGMTLSGTTFRLENDRRRNSTTTDIYSGNTHDFTWYDADVGIRWYVQGAEDMRLQNGGTLQVDGDVVAFSTTISDERLKDNVTTIENSLDKIKALRGVEYDWNAGSRKGKRDLGLIAQEVEKVIPNIVHEHEQPFLNDDENDKTLYKTVDYEKMVAVLIEGMKEQQSQIDELKSEINQLKGKV